MAQVTALMCLSSIHAWARDEHPEVAKLHAAHAAARTIRACKAIATLADRGARSLHAADLFDRGRPIDIRNNGQPERVLSIGQGSAAYPAVVTVVDGDYQTIENYYPANYLEDTRRSSEIGALRIEGRIWTVDWDAGSVDDNAALIAATDGTSICHFHTSWPTPTFKLLANGEPGPVAVYRDLLLGRGTSPPTVNIDVDAINAASDFSGMPTPIAAQEPAWHADLINNGRPLTLVSVSITSGGGRGCDYNMLGLLSEGRVTAAGLVGMRRPHRAQSILSTPELDELLARVVCTGVRETPVVGVDKRTYILAENIAMTPDRNERVDRVRLLAGIRGGTMKAIARLSWKARNDVVAATAP